MGKFEKPKNPALNYVSKEEPKEAAPVENLEGKQIVYIEVPPETKSKRKALLLFPSVHDEILKLAKEKDISFNDFANQIFKEYINAHK